MKMEIDAVVPTRDAILMFGRTSGHRRSGNVIASYTLSTGRWSIEENVKDLAMCPMRFKDAAYAVYHYTDTVTLVGIARGRLNCRMDANVERSQLYSTSMVFYHVERKEIVLLDVCQPFRAMSLRDITRALDERACVVNMKYEAVMTVLGFIRRKTPFNQHVPRDILSLLELFIMQQAMHVVTESDHYRVNLTVIVERLEKKGYCFNI